MSDAGARELVVSSRGVGVGLPINDPVFAEDICIRLTSLTEMTKGQLLHA